MADRRRINGPSGQTKPVAFARNNLQPTVQSRHHDTLRTRFLKTGVTPSASGSAYLEVGPIDSPTTTSRPSGAIKMICTVHGPRSLPRSSPFSPQLVLSTHVKLAPFASRQRRGYLRDPGERDLGLHLETALQGAIISDRWPKSGVDVVVTIVESDKGRHKSSTSVRHTCEFMNILSCCITVASAALVDAGIDCLDMVTGGVAALVRSSSSSGPHIMVDLVPSDHDDVLATCCVAYLPSRGEITNVWLKGQPLTGNKTHTRLIKMAAAASDAINSALRPLSD
jgi:exosome complex component MTR3